MKFAVVEVLAWFAECERERLASEDLAGIEERRGRRFVAGNATERNGVSGRSYCVVPDDRVAARYYRLAHPHVRLFAKEEIA